MAPFSILLAEDDPQLSRELGIHLQKAGFKVICAEDGDQALELAVREQPDLLLLDVHMPAGDGFSVYERVARHVELILTPVIYMTHDISPDIESAAEQLGAFALLQKPFDFDMLVMTMHQALRSSGAEAA